MDPLLEGHYEPKRWLNDPTLCSMVGRSMSHSLKILGLGLGASETEIKIHYRQLARKYHPDKMTTQPLDSLRKKRQNFLNYSTMRMTT
jgi:DnaJ-domain-containing protein 1